MTAITLLIAIGTLFVSRKEKMEQKCEVNLNRLVHCPRETKYKNVVNDKIEEKGFCSSPSAIAWMPWTVGLVHSMLFTKVMFNITGVPCSI